MTLNPFARTAIDTLERDALYEAERKALEHEMAAEHHDALATMYHDRARRLKESINARDQVKIAT